MFSGYLLYIFSISTLACALLSGHPRRPAKEYKKNTEGKERKGKERKGKERKGKARQSKGREGKGREGKGREGKEGS